MSSNTTQVCYSALGMTKKMFLSTTLLLTSLASCGLLYDTIDVELPPTYQGWVFLIPVQDTAKRRFSTKDGYYQANDSGVVYIPHRLTTEQFKVTIYQAGQNIQSDLQFGGLVEENVRFNKAAYRYLQFYLPPKTERERPVSDAYWEEKEMLFEKGKRARFKRLVEAGVIEFN